MNYISSEQFYVMIFMIFRNMTTLAFVTSSFSLFHFSVPYPLLWMPSATILCTNWACSFEFCFSLLTHLGSQLCCSLLTRFGVDIFTTLKCYKGRIPFWNTLGTGFSSQIIDCRWWLQIVELSYLSVQFYVSGIYVTIIVNVTIKWLFFFFSRLS